MNNTEKVDIITEDLIKICRGIITYDISKKGVVWEIRWAHFGLKTRHTLPLDAISKYSTNELFGQLQRQIIRDTQSLFFKASTNCKH